MSDLLDAAVTKYEKPFSLPIVTLDVQNIEFLLASRAGYNASGVVGSTPEESSLS
jgi:hypothetical protein